MIIYQPLSAHMRTVIREELGFIAYNAIAEHNYQRSMGEVDPRGHWELSDILELSEMAHRLRDLAETLATTNPIKIEMMRLSKAFMEDFTAVYDVAMERAAVQPYQPTGVYN